VRRYAVPIALALILLLGGILRLSGRNWDDSQNLHPDERFLTMVATQISWPDSIGGYFDSATSPLNPYNHENFPTFIYGTFPLMLGKAWGDLTGNTVYGNYHLASRSLSAIMDLATILLLFLVGRRLFGETVGLLGALLYSLSVLAIQLSHFGTFDTFVTTFSIGCFYFSLRANDNGKWWEFVLSGVMAGLAVASKLSALPILAIPAIPLIEHIRLHRLDGLYPRPMRGRLPVLLGVLIAAVSAIWTFRVGQPYAFATGNLLDFSFDPRWTRDVEYWRAIQSGEADAPPSVQWANRTPFVFVLKNLVIWGLGPALGIAALAGLVMASVRILTAKRLPPAWLLVLVGWPAFHIVYNGLAFTKTMRYLIPAYPFLALLGAAFLMGLAGWLLPRVRDRAWIAYAPLAVVVAMTALYSLAFSSIYTRPVTRAEASEWIYENIPPGSVVLTEHWDDGLPLALPGYPSPGTYPGMQMPLYDLDNAEKLSTMTRLLEDADYLFLTSNRLYDSIPRIPERYPMTIEYYRMLFAGELGFERIATFTSYPAIFGIEIPDDSAEEAFSVYDHPRVILFQKTDAFDADRVATHLAQFLDTDIVQVRSANAGYGMLMMEQDLLEAQREGGTWSRIFDPGSLANRYPVIPWYLAIQIFGLAALPLCWRIMRRLPDAAYAVSKTIGLLAVSVVAWLLASTQVIAFGRDTIIFSLILVTALSALVLWWTWRDLLDIARRSWRAIIVAEVLFLVAFLAFVWMRSGNPDLWHPARGGEKPMEFAYFNAILRSTHFPSYDPWFAGGYINYYYFGYVPLAVLSKLTGIVPEVAFNLAVAACFALVVLNAWAFVASSLRLLQRQIGFRSAWAPLALGLLGPLFVAIIGNLDMARRIGAGEWGHGSGGSGLLSLGAFGDIARGLVRTIVDRRELPTDAFWGPTRIIEGTINEFPYFSFLFADLHPHMIALPFSTAALVVALAVLATASWPQQAQTLPEDERGWFGIDGGWRAWMRTMPWESVRERALMIGLAALVTGVLYPLNTWDYPTYLLVVGGAFFMLETLGSSIAAARVGLLDWRVSFASVRRAAVDTALVLVTGRVLFLPYFQHYQVQNSGFEPWLEQSSAGEYLIIHGFLLFVIGSFVFGDLIAAAFRTDAGEDRVPVFPWTIELVLALGLLTLGVVAVWVDSITALMLSILGLLIIAAFRRQREPLPLFLIALAAIGAAISLGVEHYTLRGDIGRMNTVFKFYLQVWVLFGLVAAIGLVLFVSRIRQTLGWTIGAPWAVIFALLLGASLVYPALATPARLDDRFHETERTLDGMAYMDGATFTDGAEGLPPTTMELRQDKLAVEWLRENVHGTPVVLEAVTPLYRWGSRVSVYTGLPTVIGWDWHQTQQRPGFQPLIDQRKLAVFQMLGEARSFESIRPLLDRYDVRYIYIGPLERAYYSEEALAKFDEAVEGGQLDLVYDADGVRIYEYVPASGESRAQR
jgi:YYY domain-containing protein